MKLTEIKRSIKDMNEQFQQLVNKVDANEFNRKNNLTKLKVLAESQQKLLFELNKQIKHEIEKL